MKQSILIVEDDERLRSFMQGSLENAGYEVHIAVSVRAAIAVLRREYVCLVLLDIRLGGSNGLDVLRTIRRQDENLPVIIVSSLEDQETKTDGFELGCDDYITKPFYIGELLLRVRRLLSRSRARPADRRLSDERIESGPFELDIAALVVRKNGAIVEMRKKLFDLFLFFARHPDRAISLDTLRDLGGGSLSEMNENNLYVHIRQLRTLLEDDPSRPRFIRTVRHVGYTYSVEGWEVGGVQG